MATRASDDADSQLAAATRDVQPFDIVVVGSSQGGLEALQGLLAALPRTFALPIAVAQHRGAGLDDRLLEDALQRHSNLPVRDAEDKDEIEPGHVYLAPADYHLLVEPAGFSLSTGPPVSYARPSIDVLFESAADTYFERVIAAVLTGANRDGAIGAAKVEARGGFVVVLDPADAENPVMPEAAIAACRSPRVIPLSGIAPFLISLVKHAEARAGKRIPAHDKPPGDD